jgi:hypothetical protein
MARCRVDSTIKRVEINGFSFPLGVYPVEEMAPRPGYTMTFEPADGPEGQPDGEWEEWPDRYVFDILISATRVEPLCRALFSILPGRIFPILDVLGRDAFREVDPYVSYDLIGMDRFLDAVRRFRGFFYEDGLVGFGAMSDEPFVYIFIDEHKIVTVRAEVPLKEKIEAVLAAFDLEMVDEIAGADAATHEHRGVLDGPDDRPDLLNADEIVEDLRDEWGLVLNIDPDSNVDDEQHDLGVTGWRCVVRCDPDPNEDQPKPRQGKPAPPPPASRYAEILLSAGSLNEALDLAFEGLDTLPGAPKPPDEDDEAPFEPGLEQEEGDEDDTKATLPQGPPEPVVVVSDRLTPEEFTEAGKAAGAKKATLDESAVWSAKWLD